MNFAFYPSVSSVARGGQVSWDFCTSTAHNVVDATSMGLFDSGSGVLGDPPFTVVFPAAGKYAYVCTFHTGMGGTVKVPIAVSPHRGRRTTRFTVTWASAGASAGFVYDVQIRRPGSSHWRSWKRAVTGGLSSFRRDAGLGKYRFRARLRSTTNGHTEWSATATILVH